jgi:hypothetical protein
MEKEEFIKRLFDFLRQRSVQNLKIPQIGGKELDLYALYLTVIKRGGALNVSHNKLWKEIGKFLLILVSLIVLKL